MGGYGSSRWHGYTPKTTADSGLILNLSKVNQTVRGLHTVPPKGIETTLSWFIGDRQIASIGMNVTPSRLTLHYLQSGNPITQPIELTSTACNYGGVRRWIVCPTCNRRVLCLYNVGNGFACRLCQGLTYTSCQTSHKYETVATLPLIREFNKALRLDKLYRKLENTRYQSKRWNKVLDAIRKLDVESLALQ